MYSRRGSLPVPPPSRQALGAQNNYIRAWGWGEPRGWSFSWPRQACVHLPWMNIPTRHSLGWNGLPPLTATTYPPHTMLASPAAEAGQGLHPSPATPTPDGLGHTRSSVGIRGTERGWRYGKEHRGGLKVWAEWLQSTVAALIPGGYGGQNRDQVVKSTR